MKYVRRILALTLMLCFITTTVFAVNIVEDKNWPEKESFEKTIEETYGFDIYIEIENLSELEYMNFLTTIEYSLGRYKSEIISSINSFYNQNGQNPVIAIYSTEDYLGDYMLKNKEYIGIKLNLANKTNNYEAYKTIYKSISHKIDRFIYDYLLAEDKLTDVLVSNEVIQNALRDIDTYYTSGSKDNYVERKQFCSMIVDILEKNVEGENKYTAYGLNEPKVFTLLDPITGESTLYNETDNIFYDINIYKEKEDIYFLYKLGIIAGSKDGSFIPNKHMTRLEAAVMAGKLIMLSGCEVNEKPNHEVICKEISPELLKYVNLTVNMGLMLCQDNKPEPKQELTMEEAQSIIDGLSGLFD